MEKKIICPWWMGYLLLIPLRKLTQNPKKMLEKYIKPGMKVIDYGSAMGFFSLPMAKLVGDQGKVYCFDIQKKMLDKLISRAKKVQQGKIIEPRLVTEKNAFEGLNQTIDFALLYAVAHEVPDQVDLFDKLANMLKSGGFLLFAEPKGHVKKNNFEKSVSIAEEKGFKRNNLLKISSSHAILLEKM